VGFRADLGGGVAFAHQPPTAPTAPATPTNRATACHCVRQEPRTPENHVLGSQLTDRLHYNILVITVPSSRRSCPGGRDGSSRPATSAQP
jgi:hypothetical protein